MCPACIYGKMTRKSWRNKSPPPLMTPMDIKPGQFVSIDQLQSNVPGFIGQMKGTTTRHRFTIATAYINHASDFTYVYLQRDSSSAEMLQSKHEFERVAASHGIRITRYHSDNGRFADKAWMHDSLRQNQQVMIITKTVLLKDIYDNCRI
jgi:hypothetical protein